MQAEISAPAKINLDLRVLGRRSDGFHEIRTLLQTIDLTDEIRATVAPPDVLDLHVEPLGAVSTASDNLMIRAAEGLRRHTGIKAGARLELAKRIPIGAGLGGGSSDAAATLVLLDELWGLHLEASVLWEIAAEIGSDVPFFLTGGLALATGRGEIIQPLPDLVDCSVVVCTPPIEVATADVYSRFSAESRLTSRGSKANVDAFVAGIGSTSKVVPPWSELGNDLEPVVVGNWPEVGRVMTALKAMGPLHAAVTGSGAASFAIFPDPGVAGNGPEDWAESWNVHVGTTVGRAHGRLMVK
jgi:4-diphosphocytidyl-2-C-methyl-D-erythritol kinase